MSKFNERVRRWIDRHAITLAVWVSLGALVAVVGYAVLDFVSEVRQKEIQAQIASLKTDLAQFIMGLREEDGFPLLDNAHQASREDRPITVMSWNRPLFTYFLHRSNARSFRTGQITWEAPASCVIQFPISPAPGAISSDEPKVNVCFSGVPNDPSGRYIYFSIQYADDKVVRHVAGRNIRNADRVELSLIGDREANIDLVLMQPKLPRAYPSRHERFKGFHDVAAYLTDPPHQILSVVDAQAFERLVADTSGMEHNDLVVVGRINAAFLFSDLEEYENWMKGKADLIRVGVKIFDTNDTKTPSTLRFSTPPGATGKALRSLERLYTSRVLSKANLEITAIPTTKNGFETTLWRSEELEMREESGRDAGTIQTISNWWARLLQVGLPDLREALQYQLSIEGRPDIVVRVRAERPVLSDIASRAFFYLTLAAVILVVLVSVAWKTLRGLGEITRDAYAMTVHPSRKEGRLDRYLQLTNEIGIVARTFDVLLKRSRTRGEKIAIIRREEVRVAHEQLRTKQALLDAIGHEIKSPLQTLSTKISKESDLGQSVQRMVRAVEALFDATSIDAAFKDGKILCKTLDIAVYLSRMVENLAETGWHITYVGPKSGITAFFDPISFETVLDHLLSNAKRHRYPGSSISVVLTRLERDIRIEVFNFGEQIPPNHLETIFNLGFTSGSESSNRGLGLFAVRSYVSGMKGRVHAENRVGGVSFVIELPSKFKVQTSPV